MLSFIAAGRSKLAARSLIGNEDDRIRAAVETIDLTRGSPLQLRPALDSTSMSARCQLADRSVRLLKRGT